MTKIKSKFLDTEKLVTRLQNSKKYFFGDLKPSMLKEDLAVVYCIFDKNTNKALYVGRTTRLRRRLYTNHLQGNLSTARLKKYLIEDKTLTDVNDLAEAKKYLKDNCYFQYIPVEDVRERGHVEGMMGYMLDSKYIEKEH